jgi:hypothetical protein
MEWGGRRTALGNGYRLFVDRSQEKLWIGSLDDVELRVWENNNSRFSDVQRVNINLEQS